MVNSYRLILINVQTGHGIHVLAYTYVHDFTQARMHRWASAHICTHICVYGIHIYLQIQSSMYMSLIKEQNEHNISEVSLSSHLISPLTTRVVWAPQMILQPVSSILPCSPLPSETRWTPGPSIPWYCHPTGRQGKRREEEWSVH